jgi:3'-5' exoribonuclease
MPQIRDLQPGDRIAGSVFSVSCVEHVIIRDFQFITMTLSDCTGKCLASLLKYTAIDYGRLLSSRLIRIDGEVQCEAKYRGQIKISSFSEEAIPDDLSAFLEPLRQNNQEMQERFCVLLESVSEPLLLQLLKYVFDPCKSVWPAFQEAVAAEKMHHSFRGGLLEHTVEVADLCDAICSVVPCLDRDLIIACALLHDIGKLEEMEQGINAGAYTTSGALVGHVVSGACRVGRFANQIPAFPRLLKDTIMHMILSHQGTLEFGAARTPAFAEAEVLAQCDLISARVYQHTEAREKAQGALTVWLPSKKDGRAYTGDLGTRKTPDHHKVQEPILTYVTDNRRGANAASETPSFNTRLRIVGLAAAGSPEQSSDEDEGFRDVDPPASGADYLVRVTGDSMVDAGIQDRDLLFVKATTDPKPNDIVVAYIDASGEVVKRFRRDAPFGDSPGKAWLMSENSSKNYQPIAVDEDARIRGKITGLLRDF